MIRKDGRSFSSQTNLVRPERYVVVLVDEDRFALEALGLVLKRTGFDVTGLTNAAHALEVVEYQAPQVLVITSLKSASTAAIFQKTSELAPKALRVLLTRPEDDAHVGPPSVGRLAPPHLIMTRNDALTKLPKSLRDALDGNPNDEEAEWDEAREQAMRIVRAVARGGHEDVQHCLRVAAWSRRLAGALGLSPARMRDVELGAMLHDVGQISFPDEMLHRPGPLKQHEWGVVREHPVLGAQLLRELPLLRRAIPVVLCHHERRDGTGYPRGLQSHAIPFPARIFQVVDAYEALVTGRPWREPLAHDHALEILRTCSGTSFDPEVVATFLSLAATEWRQAA